MPTGVARRWSGLPRTLRYGLVAGCCLTLHNLIVIEAAWAGATVLQAAVASFCIMVVLGYALLSVAVFIAPLSLSGFLRYLLAMTANFPLSAGLLWALATPLALPVAIAAPLSTVVTIVMNFVWARWSIGQTRPKDARCAS